jgi:lipopolysaccharide transport system ATP-binding protein
MSSSTALKPSPSSVAGASAPPAPAQALLSPASTDIAIRARDLGKCYHIYARPQDRLKQALFRWRRTYFREFWALRAVSFDVARGESIGIVGRNGSGKSTLLQIVAGTLTPTEGSVEVSGRIAALLELGSGFNHEFTGRENVYLNGSILGLSRREMDDRFDAIAAFADIGDFIEQPVKTYSSGMLVRLAFAVQVQVEPDILIIDEALAVGDSLFQKRCYQRLEQLREKGVTILFVSHDQETVRTLTSRAILLHDGRIRCAGPSADVILDYRRLLHEEERRWFSGQFARTHPPAPAPSAAPPPNGQATETFAGSEPVRDAEPVRSAKMSFGDLDAQVLSVAVTDAAGAPCAAFTPGDPIRIAVTCCANRGLTHLNVGLRIRNKQGVKIYSWGTFNQDMEIWAGRSTGEVFWDRTFRAGEEFTVHFDFVCRLGTDFYEVQASVIEEAMKSYGSQRILHWKDEAAFFQVLVTRYARFFGGLADLCMSATAEGGVKA